jgi:hypothetical protein
VRFRGHLHAGMLLLLATMAAGCLGANHRAAVEDQAEQPNGRDRYRISSAFHANPPTCVVVLPGDGANGIAGAEQIEGALSRQLSGRIDRVIHPRERRRQVRNLAVDLLHPPDARQFAAITNCSALLRWSILDMGNDYTPFWSEKRLAIQAELIRAKDGMILWRATTAAVRTSGDPPLSLISLPFAAYKTAQFQGDQDAVASMIDDLARRLIENLPDVRE